LSTFFHFSLPLLLAPFPLYPLRLTSLPPSSGPGRSTLLFLFVVSVVALSYAMIVFERPLGPETNLDLFENSVWLIIITMTTVGYGDMYPQTPCGRYIAITAALLAGAASALSRPLARACPSSLRSPGKAS